jgi:threonine/homoserine/homoserine lactone efflux protein
MMTCASTVSLFLSIVVLALIPGPGILAVVTRSYTIGILHGVSTTFGVVVGDLIFISVALVGLAALSQLLGELFFAVKYLGAFYLVGLGMSMIRSPSKDDIANTLYRTHHATSFLVGLATTLSNPKAILFYLSLFPALLNLSEVSTLDAIVIYMVATIAVGGVLLSYAYMAYRAKALFQPSKGYSYFRRGAGVVFLCSGVYVAVRDQ